MATAVATHGYPIITRGQVTTGEDRYLILGAATYQEACDVAAASIPDTLAIDDAATLFIPRASILVRQLSGAGFDVCVAEVRYGNDTRPLSTVREETDQTSTTTFSISTTTQKMYRSLAVVQRYPASFPYHFGNLIGVEQKGIVGADIPIAQGELTLTGFLADSTVTAAYVRLLQGYAGRVTNLLPFAGYQRGELLFLGATGDKRRDGDWQVAYRMAVSLNDSNILVQGPPGYTGLSGISKAGWQYLDVLYEDVSLGETTPFPIIAKNPIMVTIHRVFDELNFADLRIPNT